MSSKPGFPSCTSILYAMTMSGTALNYMLRVNLSIAIVDMTKPSNTTVNATDNVTRFDWTNLEKNELLAIYLWGYVVSVSFGGRLADKYGGRILIGSGMLVSSVLTLFFPVVCKVHLYFAIAIRFLLGVTLGTYFPAILPMGVKWIPPLDRSKFASNLAAQGFGVAVTLPLCGYLIHYLGWESVFYVTGSICLLWCVIWFSTVYDSPGSHPRISAEEKNYIETKIKEDQKSSGENPANLPWKKLYTSLPVWAVFLAQMGNGFYHFTYTMQLPTYINDVLHFNISSNGVLSCLPFVGYYFSSLLGSYVADEMLKSKKLATFTVRRIMITISFFIPSIMMLVLAFYKMHYIAAVTLLILIHLSKGISICGYVANAMDIAPNYSGTIFGSALVLGSLSGWVGNKVVGYLTKKHSDFESWKTVFIIISLVSAAGGLFFIIFGSGEVQEWNQVKKKVEENKETEPLNV
ncbi:unnamed protein product [Brassicogethes aeneus]|uniref:Major facilitator superfamily (MFS) profile domain-containing protein n=1 Tax=Brassicogethes aeneus TaxID=1431903 RepID=A0A9P0B8Q4_BRAAE|nr:unnamed protein product [Brassicogethes aeneus]